MSRPRVWALVLLWVLMAGLASAQDNPPPHKVSTIRGKIMFEAVCAMCHAKDARGYPQLGKDLTNSAFIRRHTDDELVAFIRNGRQHTTGFTMPPKGGSPWLDKGDLYDIVAWLRSVSR